MTLSARTPLLYALALGALVALAPAYIQAHTADTEGFIIHMDETGFSPATLSIRVGETVTFENTGTLPHWPASNLHPTHDIYPEFDSKEGIAPGKSWSFRFDKPGVWKMHDHLYAQFSGTVFVEGDAPPQQAEKSQAGFWTRFKQWLFGSPKVKHEPIDAYAPEILTDDNALRRYVAQYGPARTIKHLYEVSQQSSNACHQAAHRAGRFAYGISGSQAFSECSPECHSGCYHGAVEAMFKNEGAVELQEKVLELCGDTTTDSFKRHQCTHGIGHGLMAWTNYELFDALSQCDSLDDVARKSCYTGVFMENVVGGLAVEDAPSDDSRDDLHFTKYLNSDPQYPCTTVDTKYKPECYFFQTSRMLEVFDYNFSKIVDECLKVPGASNRRLCFQSMGRDVDGVFHDDPKLVVAACKLVPAGDYRLHCIRGAASNNFWDITEQEDGVVLCEEFAKTELPACYEVLFERATHILTKREFESLCQRVGSPMENRCRAQLAATHGF